MKVMQYNPVEILSEMEKRGEWIEFRSISRKNKEVSFEEYRTMSDERLKLIHECADAAARCIEKKNGSHYMDQYIANLI